MEVNLLRKDEDYMEPSQPNFASFQGTGRKMADDSKGKSSAASMPSRNAPAGEWNGVDESQPATSLQLRLADGSRMVSPSLALMAVLEPWHLYS